MQKAVQKYCSANQILKQSEKQGAVLIGDCTSTVDKQILKPYKIGTIITIGQDGCPEKRQQGVKYILHNVLDNKSQKISDLLDFVYQQIQQARKHGGVLVNCYTGISRSASFIIAYVMRKKFISFDDAKSFVKKQRPVVHPNDNFHRQLQSYWKLLVQRDLQEKLKNTKKQTIQVLQFKKNESEITMSQISSISRKIKGVKGAVRPAFRYESPTNKSIEQTAQKSLEKKSS